MFGVGWMCSDFSRESSCGGVEKFAKGGEETLFQSESCEVINLIDIFGPSDFGGFFVCYVTVKDGFAVLAIFDLLKGLECQANLFDGGRDIVSVEATFLV